MAKRTNKTLLDKYFEGRCSLEESQLILAWIRTAPETNELNDIMKNQWDNIDKNTRINEELLSDTYTKIKECIVKDTK